MVANMDKTSGVFSGTASSGVAAWATAADGQQIRYDTFGVGRQVLVFVHGGMCDRTYWAAQTAALPTEYCAITLDLPGHGESGRSRTLWSIEGFGDDVARTVRAAGADHVVLIGHSMGALVVIEAARRLGSSVVGVLVVDFLHQPNFKPPRPPPPPDQEALKAAMRKGMFLPNSDPAIQTRIIEAMTSAPREIAMAIRQASESYDAPAGLRAIAAIPLAMIGSQIRPFDAGDIRSLHHGARIYIVPTAGHFLMIEEPAIFNALLRSEAMIMAGEVKLL